MNTQTEIRIKNVLPINSFITYFDESKQRNLLTIQNYKHSNIVFVFEIPKEIKENDLLNIIENIANSFLKKNAEIVLSEHNLFNIKSDAKTYLKDVEVSKTDYVILSNAVNQLLMKFKIDLKKYCQKSVNVSEIVLSDKEKIKRALLKTISSNIELFDSAVFDNLIKINKEMTLFFTNNLMELHDISLDDFNKKSIIFTDVLSNDSRLSTFVSIENSTGICFKCEFDWSSYISTIIVLGSDESDLENFKTLINKTLKHLIGSSIFGK